MIQFLHLQRKTAEIIHKEMSAICSEKCPSYEIVKQWKFKCSCTSLQDDLTQHSWMAFTCLFWDKEKKKEKGVNNNGHTKELTTKVMGHYQGKRCGLLSKCVLLLADNAVLAVADT